MLLPNLKQLKQNVVKSTFLVSKDQNFKQQLDFHLWYENEIKPNHPHLSLKIETNCVALKTEFEVSLHHKFKIRLHFILELFCKSIIISVQKFFACNL